jgi:hypothetical protein
MRVSLAIMTLVVAALVGATPARAFDNPTPQRVLIVR